MSEVSAVQIPVYNRSEPALWFIMCENTFKLAVPKLITESMTKFNYVVSHLPSEVASLVREYGLCVNVSKCIFGASTINFLGFNLSENGFKPLPDKDKCNLDFPKPDTLKQLRRFWDMFNFYRCFMPKAAHILAPRVQFLEGHTNKKKSHSSVRKSNGMKTQNKLLLPRKTRLPKLLFSAIPFQGLN
ncbi:hypothetical protein AVEN_79118-1 [Araneus ventricosus]|uniref:DUF7041 domain-containing protein n=1 Tax=Araneus ventricosus TaxID=182803 RepID=A0A4Y2PTQ7_ARAVE|nr:hypothetical protein AVEN_79118-1 [Araneus ventricosus]